jgi:hypothetical protein
MSKTRVTSEAKWTCPTSDEFVETRKDLIILGKAVQLFLGEDEFSIGDHLENSAPGRDERGYGVVTPLNVGRQTGGLGSVVSNLAVFDGNPHDRPPGGHGLAGTAAIGIATSALAASVSCQMGAKIRISPLHGKVISG